MFVVGNFIFDDVIDLRRLDVDTSSSGTDFEEHLYCSISPSVSYPIIDTVHLFYYSLKNIGRRGKWFSIDGMYTASHIGIPLSDTRFSSPYVCDYPISEARPQWNTPDRT